MVDASQIQFVDFISDQPVTPEKQDQGILDVTDTRLLRTKADLTIKTSFNSTLDKDELRKEKEADNTVGEDNGNKTIDEENPPKTLGMGNMLANAFKAKLKEKGVKSCQMKGCPELSPNEQQVCNYAVKFCCSVKKVGCQKKICYKHHLKNTKKGTISVCPDCTKDFLAAEKRAHCLMISMIIGIVVLAAALLLGILIIINVTS